MIFGLSVMLALLIYGYVMYRIGRAVGRKQGEFWDIPSVSYPIGQPAASLTVVNNELEQVRSRLTKTRRELRDAREREHREEHPEQFKWGGYYKNHPE